MSDSEILTDSDSESDFFLSIVIDSSLNPSKANFSSENSSTKMYTCLVLGFIEELEGGLQKQLLQSNQGTIIEHFRVQFCVTALQLL